MHPKSVAPLKANIQSRVFKLEIYYHMEVETVEGVQPPTNQFLPTHIQPQTMPNPQREDPPAPGS